MSLVPGTRLGRYEIVAPLGAGGMGEVYRARDTRLGRSVAIKILRLDHAGDIDADALRARFRREAEAIAAFKHPHICVLYDVAQHEDLDFLVMEHLEGETLAQQLRRGPLPLEDTLRHGIAIASALEAAHRRGFVHRDLKPGNVMLTADGAKVLDFGLAKPVAANVAADSRQLTRTELTAQGAVLGTLGYMSPEQLEGKPADARSDIFALGAILWEMATGRRAFEGSTQANLIAAVLTSAPPKRAPGDPPLPLLLERIIRKSLAQDPALRWQSAADVADALRWTSEDAALERPEPAPPRRRRIFAPVALIAGAVAFLAIALLIATARRPSRVAGPSLAGPVRLSIVAPPGTAFTPIDRTGQVQFALSPDGSHIAFVAARPGEPSSLWVRSLATGAARPLAGTEQAAGPFWSPDGDELAFFARGKLRRIGTNGENSRDLAEVPFDVTSGTWNRDGVILFGIGAGSGIYRVRADGGPVEPVTTLDRRRGEINHRWPQFLPDGRHFLLHVGSAEPERSGVHLASIDEDERVEILRAQANAVYSDPGYLLYERNKRLVVQAMDPVSGKLGGTAEVLSDRIVGSVASGLLPLAVASNGTLAYWSGVPTPTVLVWLDRSGRMLRTVDLDVNARSPALSPDETHLAVTEVTEERESDIWRVDLARGLASRVSFSGQARYPIWSPDSDSLVYSTMRKLYRKPASGAGDESLLFEPSGHWVLFPEDWSRDGRWVLYAAVMETGWDVSAVDVTTAESRAVIDTPANEIQARLSPRGDWVAYVSDESGTWEVYVKPFPQGSGKWQVSANGGSRPLWRGDGKEIFYVDTQDTVVAVPVIGVDAFETGLAAPLFSTRMQPMLPPYRPTYAVSDDGQRFLIENLLRHSDPSTITIVLDWQAAIEGPVEGEESPPASPNRGLLQDEDRASR